MLNSLQTCTVIFHSIKPVYKYNSIKFIGLQIENFSLPIAKIDIYNKCMCSRITTCGQ